jgi:hypothetical protein
MNRDELVSVTYEAALALNRLKLKYGLLEPSVAQGIEERIKRERAIVAGVDAVLSTGGGEQEIRDVTRRFDNLRHATICKKDEMNWPTGQGRFNLLRMIRGALIQR